jgi:hypothetical protein
MNKQLVVRSSEGRHTEHERLNTCQKEHLGEDGKEQTRIDDNMIHSGGNNEDDEN